MSDPTCEICADPARYSVEQAYITNGNVRGFDYSRQTIERHMSHVADPRALAAVTDLSNASAVASRLRSLETMATNIMDAALSPQLVMVRGEPVEMPPDLKVALAALREARATIVEMGKITETLQSQHEEHEVRPDLDDALSAYLSGKEVKMDNPDIPNPDYEGLRALEAGES